MKIHNQILLAIIVGVAVGFGFGDGATVFGPIGTLFIKLLKMIIVPLLITSIMTGITSLGSTASLGRLGSKTVVYYLCTTAVATMIGLMLVNLIQPGVGATLDLPVTESIEVSPPSLWSILTGIVPGNVFQAMAENKMLSVIFLSILFGCAFIANGPAAKRLVGLLEEAHAVVMRVTHWIILLAPYGVFALVANLVGSTGFAAFKPLGAYMATVLIGLAVHAGVLTFVLKVVGRRSTVPWFKAMFPAFATAFATDSSSATLPVTLECLEDKVGISNEITGFVAPLGSVVNMDGTALYEAIAALFIAQIYGIDLTLGQQCIIALTAILASIGAAGIPSAGLVTMVVVLKSVNLPLEGIGMIFAVDRILDMCRTVVNVMGDAVGATVIARFSK